MKYIYYISALVVWIFGVLLAIFEKSHDTTVMWIGWAVIILIGHIDRRTENLHN